MKRSASSWPGHRRDNGGPGSRVWERFQAAAATAFSLSLFHSHTARRIQARRAGLVLSATTDSQITSRAGQILAR
ncbi:hypothetical protein [Lysobacter gummosus]|uniref:hypothetical protein n=1 Tax=Lysobacter gummosus TaxID=262324 RepID=UPI003625C4D4